MALLGQGWDDPKSSAIMALAGGLLQGNMGAGLLGASDAYGQAKAQGAKAQLAQLQMQEAQMKMEEAARQRQFLQNLPMQGNNPLLHQAAQAGVIPVGDYLKSTLPKPVEFGKIDPKDYTPESLREAVTTGDYTKLVPVRKLDVVNNQAVDLYNAQPGQVFDTFDPNKPFNLQGGKLAPNQAFQNYEMGKARAGATNVNVDTAPKAFWGDFGRSASDALFKEREGAQAAATVLQGVGEIRQAVAGGSYQGAGAELKLGAAKALNALGANIDPKTVANSEIFNANAKQFVLAQIKMLGANPSNADREFIEKTVPSLSTDPGALPRLLNFIEGKARTQVEGYNSKIRNVQKQPGAGFMPFSLEVPAPQAAPAKPQATLRWNPQTRKLEPVN